MTFEMLRKSNALRPVRTGPDAHASALPDRIRHARKQSRLTQAELAKRIGVGASAVAQWEMSKGTSPTLENLAKVAVSCDVSFEWLATGRGPLALGLPEDSVFNPSSIARDYIEDRLLIAFRRIATRKREAFVRWVEEMF